MKNHIRTAVLLVLLAACVCAVGVAFGRDNTSGAAKGTHEQAPAISCYFSPHGDAKDAIIAEIDGAREEILVAMYNLTSADIAKALVRAKEHGVSVTVVLDKGQKIHDGSGAQGRQSRYLAENGIKVAFDAHGGLMHNKFAVIDRKTVITGSYNWTDGAEDKNFENVVIVHSADLAKRYADDFAQILAYAINVK
jgi:phosphatidylserine/phosphatidylglycerophosphate/cardiolipin synthase-like enzyme